MRASEFVSERYEGGLRKWFKQKWVNIAKKEGGRHPECGTSGEKRGYAKCVPAAKARSMSAAEKKSAVSRKRSAQRAAGRPGKDSGGTGQAPVRVSTAPKNEDRIDELTFKGSQCTKDCSGHRAGYEWHKIKQRDPNSWSPSFNKGAALSKAGV